MKPNEIISLLSKYQLHEKKDIILHEYNMDYSTFLIQENVILLQNDYNTDEPLAYILGYTTFMGKKIFVNNNTLIPRIESEVLIDFALNNITDNMNVLDLCAGSGVLGIILELEKNITLTSADISKDALEVCEYNKKFYNLNSQNIQGDMFENINFQYDCIIFNPPYVNREEHLEDSVYKYEPHLALFGDNNGLEFYERFFEEVDNYLAKFGIIIIEIGDGQFQDIKQMMNQFENITLIHDFFGRERGIYASKR